MVGSTRVSVMSVMGSGTLPVLVTVTLNQTSSLPMVATGTSGSIAWLAAFQFASPAVGAVGCSDGPGFGIARTSTSFFTSADSMAATV